MIRLRERSAGTAGGKPPGTTYYLILCPLEDLLWGTLYVIGCFSVHDLHVVDTVGNLLPYVMDEKVSLFSQTLHRVWRVFGLGCTPYLLTLQLGIQTMNEMTGVDVGVVTCIR